MKISKEEYTRLVKATQLLEDLEFFNCIDYNKYNREQDNLTKDLAELDNKPTYIEEDHLYENL